MFSARLVQAVHPPEQNAKQKNSFLYYYIVWYTHKRKKMFKKILIITIALGCLAGAYIYGFYSNHTKGNKNMNYIFVADKKEANNIKIPNELKDNVKIVVLNEWGETAVIRTLSEKLLNGEFKKTDRFFNIGYVGSNEFPIGKVVVVGTVSRENPSHTVNEPTFILDKESKVKCYSSLDFVESTKHSGVFDMELYTFATFFPNIKSVKIVSDNLNFHEFEQVTIDNAWVDANKILFDMISNNK